MTFVSLFILKLREFYEIILKNKHFMPIKSYLVHPHEGKKEVLIQALSEIDNCEVVPAENRDLLILVTDTQDNTEDQKLNETIEAIESLKLLVMVSGFDTKKNN